MAADHPHSHHADHAHPRHDHHNHPAHHHAAPQGRALLIGIALNLAFVIVEFISGLLADSLALIADAGHNLSDVLGLTLAWAAMVAVRRAPTKRFTYGFGASSILAALGNGLILAAACGVIAWEAINRFSAPHLVASTTVIIVAAIGIAVNGLTALTLHRHSHDDLNIRGAYLHMLGDAAVSLGVVIAGVTMQWTGWQWLDPSVSLVIVVVIMVTSWSLLRASVRLAMAGVPEGIDIDKIEQFLRAQVGVGDVHDLHVWAMSTTETALTVHLIMPAGHPGDAFLGALCHDLDTQFRIGHPTIQIETGDSAHPCTLTTAHRV